MTVITLLLFVGATGKSAQLPLYVWLPDAMAGPTPVCALIHAATMVTAGVYMIARLNFLYVLAPTTMAVVATVGAVTALFAATIGLVQNDIKKVLAYSTVSQLGYMFLGVGVGAFGAGIFHLMTHAFFKGLLFLGVGQRDPRHERRAGHAARWVACARTCRSPSGPSSSARWPSPESRRSPASSARTRFLAPAFGSPYGSWWLWALGLIAAGLTAFYMFRLLFLTFFGECRADEHAKHHLHESPPSMTMPLIVLAILSLVGGWVGLAGALAVGRPLRRIPRAGIRAAPHVAEHHDRRHRVRADGRVGAGGDRSALGVAYLFYVVQPGLPMLLAWKAKAAYDLIFNKYYVDELYDAALRPADGGAVELPVARRRRGGDRRRRQRHGRVSWAPTAACGAACRPATCSTTRSRCCSARWRSSATTRCDDAVTQ